MHLRIKQREGPITTASTAVPAWPSPRFSTWRYWLAPFIWIVLNFIASSDLLSSGHTAVMLTYVLNLLHVHVQDIALLNHVLRKLGHFTAYAILGGLFFRAWRVTLPAGRQLWRTDPRTGNPVGVLREKLWTLRWSALAVASAALAAALDEFHQSFVPTRGSSVRDVLLDTAGAIFLQLILMVMWINKEVASHE